MNAQLPIDRLACCNTPLTSTATYPCVQFVMIVVYTNRVTHADESSTRNSHRIKREFGNKFHYGRNSQTGQNDVIGLCLFLFAVCTVV